MLYICICMHHLDLKCAIASFFLLPDCPPRSVDARREEHQQSWRWVTVLHSSLLKQPGSRRTHAGPCIVSFHRCVAFCSRSRGFKLSDFGSPSHRTCSHRTGSCSNRLRRINCLAHRRASLFLLHLAVIAQASCPAPTAPASAGSDRQQSSRTSAKRAQRTYIPRKGTTGNTRHWPQRGRTPHRDRAPRGSKHEEEQATTSD